MRSIISLAAVAATTALAVVGGTVVAAQNGLDKYGLKVPGRLAFSEVRGYEDWAVISVGRTDELIKVILGNPVVIDARRLESA
jgi:hypothetical protein